MESGSEAESYWYANNGVPGSRASDVLKALRRFHAADLQMRQRLKTDMDMNDNDLHALRYLIAAESRGQSVGPTDLARELGVSTAATAKLLARLDESGHVRRELNPRDGRAQLLHPTTSAHHEVRKTLGSMHERMLAVAEEFTAEQQRTVIHFLDLLSAAVAAPHEVAAPAALFPTTPTGAGPTEPDGVSP